MGQTIPAVFHWIWLGPADIPNQHQAWMTGWLRRHPGWTSRVWRDRDVPRLRNHEAFDDARSLAQKSDVLRYEILLEHGGVYLDTDMECLRPIDQLVSAHTAFLGAESPSLLGNSILGAVPGHEWMRDLVAALGPSFREHWLTLDQTGPSFVTRVTANRKDVAVFPPVTFYPVPSRDERLMRQEPGPDSYAIHHWAKSWQAIEVKYVSSETSRVLASLIPQGATVVLVAENIEVDLPADCRISAFVERAGEDWGPPANDEEAIRELEEHIRRGTQWVVFLAPAAWWLDYYAGLSHRLREQAHRVVETQCLTAFQIGQ